jgi:hypothetical protein
VAVVTVAASIAALLLRAPLQRLTATPVAGDDEVRLAA